jgi:hypothetical protein
MIGFKRQNSHFNVKLSELSRERRLAQSMNSQVSAFIGARFIPTYASSLDFLRGQLDKATNRDYAPPLVVAWIEFAVFKGDVLELKAYMTQEIQNTFCEWLEADDMIRALFQRLIDSRVSEFQNRFIDAGWQLFLDRAEVLNKAEVVWRAANPVLSEEFRQLPLGLYLERNRTCDVLAQ